MPPIDRVEQRRDAWALEKLSSPTEMEKHFLFLFIYLFFILVPNTSNSKGDLLLSGGSQ